MSGQLCKVAEGLSYNDITLAHRHPPPSPQNSDTCANPVQNLGAPRLSIDILDSYIFVPSGNLAWSRPVQISTSKIASLAFWEIEGVPWRHGTQSPRSQESVQEEDEEQEDLR